MSGKGPESFDLRQPPDRIPAGAVASIPGVDFPLLNIDLPAGLRGATRQAVARQQIVGGLGLDTNANELHPLSPKRNAGWSRAILGERAALDKWRMAAQSLSNKPRAILPDYLTLPAGRGLLVITHSGDNVVARIGTQDGFAAEPALAATMLENLISAQSPDAVLALAELPSDILNVLNQAGLTVFHDGEALVSAGYPRPVRFGHGELSADLSQSDQAQIDRTVRSIKAWFAPVALGIAAFGVWATATQLGTARMQDEAAALRRGAAALAGEVLLPGEPILDLRRQVAARLDKLALAAQFDTRALLPPLDILRVASGLSDLGGVDVRLAEFQVETGLKLEIEAPDFAALENAIAQLRASGLEARIGQSSSTRDQKVAATLFVSQAEGEPQ